MKLTNQSDVFAEIDKSDWYVWITASFIYSGRIWLNECFPKYLM